MEEVGSEGEEEALEEEVRLAGGAEGSMEDGAALAEVEAATGKHRFRPGRDKITANGLSGPPSNGFQQGAPDGGYGNRGGGGPPRGGFMGGGGGGYG